MAADQLELGADDAFLGQKCNDLMPEEVRVDAFLNPCCQGVLMNDLTDATIGIGPEAVGLEEKNCPVILQSLRILEQFTPETGWKQDTSVFTSFALPYKNPPVVHVYVLQSYSCQFGVP